MEEFEEAALAPLPKTCLDGIKAVLFDFDGTLADTASDIAAAVNAALKHFDLPALPERKIRAFVGHGSRDLIRRAAKSASESLGLGIEIPAGIIDAIHAWYLRYYSGHPAEKSRLYPGTFNFLKELDRRGIMLGVVTNKPSVICRKILSYFGIAQFFSVVVGQENVRNLKPHPEGIERAVRAISAKIAGAEDCDLPVLRDDEAALQRAIAFVAADDYEEYDDSADFDEDEPLVPAPMSKADIIALANSIAADDDEDEFFEPKPPEFPLLRPDQVLMVGDSEGDILAGAAFGCKTAAVTGGFGNPAKLMAAPADFVVQFVAELA